MPTAATSWTATDYNQFSISTDDLRYQSPFMTENMEGIESLVVDDEVIAIEIPDAVELPIVDTSPGVRGNSATGRTKPAKLVDRPYHPGPRAPQQRSDCPSRYPNGRVSRTRELTRPVPFARVTRAMIPQLCIFQ